MSNGDQKTGGCQCGAVRFKIDKPLGRASICHCRMCQKAFGNFFGSLVSVDPSSLTWSKGKPAHFASSNFVRRGFCKSCGTPLTFEHGKDGVEIAIGAFDDPNNIVPVSQLSHDTAVPYFDQLSDLFKRDISDGVANKNSDEELKSYQHPDHEK